MGSTIYNTLAKQDVHIILSEESIKEDVDCVIKVSKETSNILFSQYDHYWLRYFYKVALKEEDNFIIDKEDLGAFKIDTYIFFKDKSKEFVLRSGTLKIYNEVKNLKGSNSQKVKKLLELIN